MPTVRVPGKLTTAEESRFRDNLRALVSQFSKGQRRLTVGTLVGSVRTKSFPENPIAGQPVRVVFVADVRLREFTGQPIARDVLITNQAHQLVSGSDAEGTPVTLEISPSGAMTVVARAGFQSDTLSSSFYTVEDLDGVEMEFAVGLRLRNVDDLDPALLVDLNAWRVAHGKVALLAGEKYFLDPQADVHGERYFLAYIGLTDGGRFLGAAVGLVCQSVTISRDWYDDDVSSPDGDWWYGTPNAFPGQDPWYASRTEVQCT